METKEKPKPETIIISDIPLHDFEQFEAGTRFSIQFTNRTPPIYKQRVELICEPKAGQVYGKKSIFTSILHVIFLDTLLATKNFYDATLDLKKNKKG